MFCGHKIYKNKKNQLTSRINEIFTHYNGGDRGVYGV